MKTGIICLQIKIGENKKENVSHTLALIREAVTKFNPRLICLPECFNGLYGVEYFSKNAEIIPGGYTSNALSNISKELNIYIVGGSIIECESLDSQVLYNTIGVWGPNGELICKHRKCHLYDVQIIEGLSFCESSVLKSGKEFTIFKLDGKKIGLGVCFDIQFDEMHKIYQKLGTEMLIFPACYPIYHGSLHWDLLLRSRAVDNQCYVVGIERARQQEPCSCYGHSAIINPWGQVLIRAGSSEEIIYFEIDWSAVSEVRRQVPIIKARRTDMYNIRCEGSDSCA